MMMNRGVHSDSIPIDLIVEIFSRLPAKSIVRFRCVSKLWESILHRPYFTELFLTMSSARPRILLVIERDGGWNFYSSPQSHNRYEKSSLVVSADFRMKLPQDVRPSFRSLTSGLIHISNMQTSKKSEDTLHVICNPSTRQFGILPDLRMYPNSFLGFDPIGKQYKVLCMDYSSDLEEREDCRVLTLGPGEMRWRNIQCHVAHNPWCEGICINGILYYLAGVLDIPFSMIVCFDVRFEKFKFIYKTELFCTRFCDVSIKLVNYKGKLGVINRSSYSRYYTYPIKLYLWVLEDVEKQEWSKYVYTLPKNEVDPCKFVVVGVTSTGEIVLSSYTYKVPFYVYYFSPETKILQPVEIQGVGEYHEEDNYSGRVHVALDHVEDLKFNITKTTYAPISISPLKPKRRRHTSTSTSSKGDHHKKQDHHRKQDRRTFESINKFDALHLLDDDDE